MDGETQRIAGRNGCTLPGQSPRHQSPVTSVSDDNCIVHYEPHTKRKNGYFDGRSSGGSSCDEGIRQGSVGASPQEYRFSRVSSYSNSPRDVRSDSALTENSVSTLSDIYTTLNGTSTSSSSSHHFSVSASSDDDNKRNSHSTSLPNMVDLFGRQLSVSDGEGTNRSTRSLPVQGQKGQPRRCLPQLRVTQEDMQQKQQSISEQFSKKLRQYIKTKKEDKPAPPPVPPSECDETMSVTSLEVADILAGAAPPGLSDDEEDDETEVDDTETVCSDTETIDGDSEFESLPPLVQVEQPVDTTRSNRLNNFVEQSMESFLTNVHLTPQSNSNNQPNVAHREPPDPRQNRFPITSHHTLEQRPVSVFTLIQNYSLSSVVLSKLSEKTNCGITLRDKMVSFQSYNSSVLSDKSNSCILPCIATIEPSDGVALTGSVLKGDLLIEVNGRSAFNMAARHVTSFIDQSKDIELVVARKRVYINKTTCTSPRAAAF